MSQQSSVLSWLQSLKCTVVGTILGIHCRGYNPWNALSWVQSLEYTVVGTILGIHPSDNNLRTFALHVTTVPGAIGFVSLEG